MVEENNKIAHSVVECNLELEPALLQWSGQKPGLDYAYNLLMCHGITSLPILHM